MQAGHPVTMLSVQYRMHPKISSFISQYFYQEQLTDGPGLDRCAASAMLDSNVVHNLALASDVDVGRRSKLPSCGCLPATAHSTRVYARLRQSAAPARRPV